MFLDLYGPDLGGRLWETGILPTASGFVVTCGMGSENLPPGSAGILSAHDQQIDLIEHRDVNHQHDTRQPIGVSSDAPGGWPVVCRRDFTLMKTLLWPNWDPEG